MLEEKVYLVHEKRPTDMYDCAEVQIGIPGVVSSCPSEKDRRGRSASVTYLVPK